MSSSPPIEHTFTSRKIGPSLYQKKHDEKFIQHKQMCAKLPPHPHTHVQRKEEARVWCIGRAKFSSENIQMMCPSPQKSRASAGESASKSLMGFGELNDNMIKELMLLLKIS